jgi:hypothetical protein
MGAGNLTPEPTVNSGQLTAFEPKLHTSNFNDWFEMPRNPNPSTFPQAW